MTAVYVQNKSPHKTLRNMTPEEAFTRVKLEVGHLGYLGVYIPGQRQIEVSRGVTFEEEVAFRRSRGSHMEIDSER
jgi:hypothetical protein